MLQHNNINDGVLGNNIELVNGIDNIIQNRQVHFSE